MVDEATKVRLFSESLTPEAVQLLLNGTGLVPPKGWSWLTGALRGVLWTCLMPDGLSADRKENAAVRDELYRLAKAASDTSLVLFDRSRDADGAIWDAACRGWNGAAGEEPPDHRSFNEAVRQLEWLSVFLRRAGMALDVQSPQWRNSARREQRVWRAQCLSALYVEAFGQDPTINNWETATGLGPWPAFYQRIVAAAFGETNTPNRLEVLKEARHRDKLERVRFGDGILPK